MPKKYLLLYSTNIAVKGEKNGAIYCLDRGSIYPIPLSLYSVLKELEKRPFNWVKSKYSYQNEIFDSYVDLLFKENLVFFTDNPKAFPNLKIQYHAPETITCATIEFSGQYKFELLIKQLDDCNCKHLRIHIIINLSSLRPIFDLLEESNNSSL